jgi:hypothetical protein
VKLCLQCHSRPMVIYCANNRCKNTLCSSTECSERCKACKRRICLPCGLHQELCSHCEEQMGTAAGRVAAA